MKKPLPTPPTATLQTHLGYWLRLVSNQVSAGFARGLQARELSVAEWVALKQIEGASAVTPAQVAAATGMTRGAISKVLDKLEERRWLARSLSISDNRVQHLALTARARHALPELTAIANQNDEHFFHVLDGAEQALLRGLLQKLAAAHHLHTVPVD
jgi:DNA-binding MarR family transcriptional regulator